MSLFSRKNDDGASSQTDSATSGQPAPDADAEPGSVSSQLDVEGRGPVTLDERTKPGGQASPDTNQGKAEPMPATPGDPDPTAPLPPPELGDMNVGGADPQTPSHAAARDRDVSLAGGTVYAGPHNAGTSPEDDRPALDQATSTGTGGGPERPAQATAGRAQRQAGSLGESPEEQETDVEAGAARMVPGAPPASSAPPVPEPGDPQQVSVPHDLPMEGTSETQSIVHGVRAAMVPGEEPTEPVADGTHPDGSVDRDVQGRDVLHADGDDRTTP
jgi:hypothetical protein